MTNFMTQQFGSIAKVPSLVILIAVFLIGLIVFHLLERFFPPIIPTYTTGPRRRGYLADITASLIDGPVFASLSKLAWYAVIIYIPSLNTAGISGWPWWAQFGLFLLVNDFLRYWLHRWYHTNEYLWRIHRVHHTAVEMDALSTNRVHAMEGVLKYGLIFIPFYFANIDRSVILVYSSIDILKGFWHHANLRTTIGPLNYFFNSAELHWWHHSTAVKGQMANFGSMFSIWDWLFGTAYYEKGVWPQTIGVDGMENFPDTYHELFASAIYDNEAAKRKYPGSVHRPAAEIGTLATGDPAAFAPAKGRLESAIAAPDAGRFGEGRDL